MLQTSFVSQQRTSLKWDDVVESLWWTYRSKGCLTKEEVDERLHTLMAAVPQWLSATKISTGVWLQINPAVKYQKVRGQLLATSNTSTSNSTATATTDTPAPATVTS